MAWSYDENPFLWNLSLLNFTVCWARTSSKLFIASFEVLDSLELIFAQHGYFSKSAVICLQLSISFIASVYSDRVSSSWRVRSSSISVLMSPRRSTNSVARRRSCTLRKMINGASVEDLIRFIFLRQTLISSRASTKSSWRVSISIWWRL